MYSDYEIPVSKSPVQRSQSQTNVYQAMQLVGRQVKVNRGGPDSVSGALIAIPGDFLVVSTKNGVVYVNGSHVKSITEGSTTGGKSNEKSSGKSGGRSWGRSSGTPFIKASNFNSLLSQMRHQFIQINRGGPEKAEGFLAETNSNFLLLVVKRELVRIPIFHIKTVNITEKSQSDGNKNNNNNNNNKSSNNKKSDGNKSGSNKSGSNKSGSNKSGSNKTGGNKNRASGERNKGGSNQKRNGRRS